MPSGFSSLPFELRHQIYDQALDRTPRNVEVEVRNGKVVPKTPPPALLHVNRESRNFVLSIYKPWLPQFAGSPIHARYAALLAKYDHSKNQPVSCLDNVCFDMEHDMLFCQGRLSKDLTGWPAQLFGRLEQLCLKNMVVNIDGNLDDKLYVAALMKAKRLKTLCFLDTYATFFEKRVDLYDNVLRKLAKRDKARNVSRAYVAPQVMMAPASHFFPKTRQESSKHWYTCALDRESSLRYSEFDPELLVSCQAWTTYRYHKWGRWATRTDYANSTKPTKDPRPTRPTERARGQPRKAPMVREVHEANPTTRSVDRPRKAPIVKEPNPRKRKAGKELDAALAVVAAKRANRTTIWIHPDVLAGMSDQTRLNLGIAVRAAPSTAGAASNSAAESEASMSDAESEASSQPASDAESVHEDDSSEESASESDDAHEEVAASREHTPRQLHAHRFNFDLDAPEILVEWEDSPEMATWEWVPKADLLTSIPVMVAAFCAQNAALETGNPVRFHERNSGVVGFDFLVEFEGYPEELYWTWVPESNMQTRVPHMVDHWRSENASEVNADENVDEQILAEQNYAEHVRAEDNDVKEEEQVEQEEKKAEQSEEKSEPKDAEMKNEEDAEDEDVSDDDAGDEETSEYVPKRFVAQRETPDGPEILVEWEDWPDEKDWTWEPVSNLQEDAPEMMKAWKASRKAKKVSKVFEVESILGKRKIKGEWHYLVKWKGFSKDEAKSLEPCEKLAVDVPELVEAFEKRKPKRGRPKRAVDA